ncbi:la-related protein 1A-like isoform X2 [Vigna unguiculata]|uniref:la-related protein 1A-like isoform X2 n=1 Tax=Vigna unguiculata TaxID=3917 RepID=UPI001016FDA8|nr:la-related protein 1A-like isoform X2 [Vigna unguiculata]
MDAGSLSSSGALKDRMTLSSSRTVYSKKEFPKKCCQTSLANTIVNQIDYYFNDANLVRDEYLRFNMDEQRWVPISLIASFLVSSSYSCYCHFVISTVDFSGFSSSTCQHRENYYDWTVFYALQYTHHSRKHLMDHQLLGRLNLNPP